MDFKSPKIAKIAKRGKMDENEELPTSIKKLNPIKHKSEIVSPKTSSGIRVKFK